MKANGHNQSTLPDVVSAAAPAWISTLRAAAQRVITSEVIEQIVTAQVERAKAGDKDALKFVFEQVLGGSALKGATLVQNVFMGEAAPEQPTTARPGTHNKLATMQARAARGESLNRHDDGPEVDLS